MQRRRQRQNHNEGRLVRRRGARGPQLVPPDTIMHSETLATWIQNYARPENIIDGWSFLGQTCSCPEVMSQLVFACMSGITRLPGSLENSIRYSIDQDHQADMSAESLSQFLALPIPRAYMLPTGAFVTISVFVDGEWIDWVKVNRDSENILSCFACRDFVVDEVVTVFGGRTSWRSHVAYMDCTLGRSLADAPDAGSPMGYCRARDGMLHVFDAGRCSLLLGASCCNADSSKPSNLSLSDSGEYIATESIISGEELIVDGNL